MTAREEILASVRAALADAPAAPTAPTRLVSEPLGDRLLDLFADRVADYRADVIRCGAHEVEEQIAAALGGARVVVPTDLPWAVAGAIVDDGLTALELDEIEAVVTAAAVGVAETGTVVLDHGAGQGRRALSLVPDLHVLVVEAGQVVAGVPEAVGQLNPARPQTWISGPSATSDIELTRVEGVHGPRRLVVLLVS